MPTILQARSASSGASSSAASIATPAATFRLYGCLIVISTDASAGAMMPYPARSPARPAHLLNVRSTTRFSCSPTSGPHECCRARRTRCTPRRQRRAGPSPAAARALRPAVGSPWDCSARRRRSPSPRGASLLDCIEVEREALLPGAARTRAPATSAENGYIPNVGGQSMIASPGVTTARRIRSIRSSLPSPQTMPSARRPRYAASAFARRAGRGPGRCDSRARRDRRERLRRRPVRILVPVELQDSVRRDAEARRQHVRRLDRHVAGEFEQVGPDQAERISKSALRHGGRIRDDGKRGARSDAGGGNRRRGEFQRPG